MSAYVADGEKEHAGDDNLKETTRLVLVVTRSSSLSCGHLRRDQAGWADHSVWGQQPAPAVGFSPLPTGSVQVPQRVTIPYRPRGLGRIEQAANEQRPEVLLRCSAVGKR
jgi:hypothetical protein